MDEGHDADAPLAGHERQAEDGADGVHQVGVVPLGGDAAQVIDEGGWLPGVGQQQRLATGEDSLRLRQRAEVVDVGQSDRLAALFQQHGGVAFHNKEAGEAVVDHFAQPVEDLRQQRRQFQRRGDLAADL